MPVITAQQAGGANRCAFLDMIAWSEIGPALLAATDNGYDVLVGATPANPLTFASYAKHPDVLNHDLDSTAAGRYQEKWGNWLSYSALLKLPDFGPLSQDRMAIQQIREARALPFIDAGNFVKAVQLCAHLWASLPGNDYKQHINTISSLQASYVRAGGTLARTA